MKHPAVLRKVEIISRPVEPLGDVIRDDGQIEFFNFGDVKLIGGVHCPSIRLEVARHHDLWMWASSVYGRNGGYGYRVGPKWGNFVSSRRDAISAACNEVLERVPAVPREAVEWMTEICGAKPRQMELFQ